MRKRLSAVLLTLLLLLTGCSGSVSQSDYDAATELNEQLQAQVIQLEADIDRAQQTIEELEKELSDAEQQVDTLTAEQQSLLDSHSTTQEELSALQEQVATLQAENDQLSSAVPVAADPAPVPAAEEPAEVISVMVWIPRTGSKYHARSSCSNMKNPTEVTKEQAIASGYGQCSKCW